MPQTAVAWVPMALPRRRFLLSVAGLIPVPFLARRLHSSAVADLDPKVLRTLGAAILPGEMGTVGVERTVSGFERWLAGYREGAELVHGYGTGELRTTGPSPALRWSAQLQLLAKESFTQLTVEDRKRRVLDALSGIRPGSLLQFDRAPHIALGLLGFFYSSPEATDLCYQARIGPNTCRPLDQAPKRPLPLAGNG